MKKESVYFKGRRGRTYDIVEAEANHFADSLLMPEDMIKGVVKTKKYLDAIAAHFEVPILAAERRLLYLGYKLTES